MTRISRTLYFLLFILLITQFHVYGQNNYKMIIHAQIGNMVLETNRIDSITFKDNNVGWTDNSSLNQCIEEFYVKDLIERYGFNCYIGAFESGNCSPRLFMYNKEGAMVAQLKEYSSSYTSDYYSYGSFSPIIDVNTRETIGFVKLSDKYSYLNSGFRAYVDADIVADINNSPLIKKILEGNNQIVLLGDSKFGYYWSNFLPDMLMGLANCNVYNCGFGGCNMAWRSKDGVDPYDYFSFPSLCDAIVNNNFDNQKNYMPLSDYRYQLENLKSIDFRKETTIIVNYGTNDITGGTLIKMPPPDHGNIVNLDRSNFAEAMMYGVLKFMESFPHVKFVFLSPDYRLYNDNGIDEYINDRGFNIWDYYKSMQEVANNLNCRFVDSYHLDFRTPQNINDYTVDGVHFNGLGFSKYAQFLYYVWRFN